MINNHNQKESNWNNDMVSMGPSKDYFRKHEFDIEIFSVLNYV